MMRQTRAIAKLETSGEKMKSERFLMNGRNAQNHLLVFREGAQTFKLIQPHLLPTNVAKVASNQ